MKKLRTKSYRLRFVFALCLLTILNCTQNSGCAPKAKPEKPYAQKKTEAAPKLLDLPALSLEGLSNSQKNDFLNFTNEEVCPCDCPQTFAQCLQTTSQCKPAIILGQWVVELLKQGMPLDMIQEPLAKEIGLGFRSQPQIIDLAGFGTKGAANPKITIVEFADFECAHCITTAAVLKGLVEKHPNDIKFVFKHFPLSMHHMSKKAAIAAEAASQQDKFWEMHDMLFSTSQPLNDDMILAFAEQIGITGSKLTQFKADLLNPKVIAQVENCIKEAEFLNLTGTPSIFFNGRPYYLSLDLSGIQMRIDMENARSESTCN